MSEYKQQPNGWATIDGQTYRSVGRVTIAKEHSPTQRSGGYAIANPDVLTWPTLETDEQPITSATVRTKKRTVDRETKIREMIDAHTPKNADEATRDAMYSRINRLAARFNRRTRPEFEAF